jgi:hypothetical protein
VKPLLPLLLLLCASGVGCETATKRSEADTQALEATVSTATRAWELVAEGRVIGVLVEFQERGGSRRFFSVRNESQQELGMIDAQGRAWRFIPHAEDPEWLGTGTVLEGACRVLRIEAGAAQAYEVDLSLLASEAAATKLD